MAVPLLFEQTKYDDDLKAVQELFGPAFAELAGMFQVDTRMRIMALHEAAAAGDAREISAIGHVLSGSAVAMGAKGLSVLCKALEQQARSGSLEDIENRLRAIEEAYADIDQRLRSMVE